MVTRAAGEVGAVFGLTKQIGSHDFRVGGFVGDHRDLARSGEQVDGDLAEELPFGLGDEGVAGPDQHVDRRVPEKAKGHGGQRLHAAQQEDVVGAGDRCRVQHGGIGGSVGLRRCAGQNAVAAGHLGHIDRHERAGQQRETARRQIGTDPSDRNIPHTGDKAGYQFGLEIHQVRTGFLRKFPGPGRTQLECLLEIGFEALPACRNGGGVQFNISADGMVEFGRIFQYGIHPALLDRRQHLADGRDHIWVTLGGRPGLLWGLQDFI